MVVCRLVEGGAYHLGIHATGHVGYLLWALIDEEDDHVYLWMIGSYGVGQLLEEDRLPGFWLRYYKAALPLADGGEEVDNAHGEAVVPTIQQGEFLVRE